MLTACAVLFVGYVIICAVVQTEWTSWRSRRWLDVVIEALLLLGLAVFCTRWTFRTLRRQDGKSDRVILLTCIFLATYMLGVMTLLLLPETFFDTLITAFWLFWTPVSFWFYRKLEVKWTADQEIYPLEAGVIWPVDRRFLQIQCVFFWLAWMMGVACLSDDLSENFTLYYATLLPLIAAVLIYRLGVRLLK